MMTAEEINKASKEAEKMPVHERIRHFSELCGNKIVFASSLGAEDMVITHMIYALKLPVKIFTLDTGRLFSESYALIERIRSRYGIKVDIYFPDAASVEKMVDEHGINLFYDSLENRKLCCKIRKTDPLKRALAGYECWITGLRREQAVTRSRIEILSMDEENGLLKLNPLLDWSEEQVWSYIREHNISYNPLHDKGYRSIGCAPCTRPVAPGEDLRAGRWWWENPEHKECGLHLSNGTDNEIKS